jgi:pimeloyl-ACP methyl ester carboxylesterase
MTGMQHVHVRRGGRPVGPTLVLLHGLGATGAVWEGVARIAESRWQGPWIAPDLSGHGRSAHLGRYSFGGYAAEVARLLPPQAEVVTLGHSMGGVVALALASGWFGVTARATVGLGIKVRWSPEDLEGAAALAEKPRRSFPTLAEAVERYTKVSGLAGLLDPADDVALEGVIEHDGGWVLAHDPASFAVGAPDMVGLLAAARGRVVLGAGEHDRMSAQTDLAELVDAPALLAGLGHNAHVEDPDAVWGLLEQVAGEHAAAG